MRILAISVAVTFLAVATSVTAQPVASATEDQPAPFVPTLPIGMSRVSDIPNHPDTPQPPRGLTAVGGELLFLAADGLTYRLWRSDGTEEGTGPVSDRPSFDCGEDWSWCEVGFELVESGGLVYLAPNSGRGLWRSDGTDDGTFRVADVPAGYLHDIDDALYFVGDGNRGPELWRSDGSVDGTAQVRDIAPGRFGSICPMTGGDSCLDEVYTMGQLGGRVFFGANEGTRDRAGGDDLWVSDGSRRGTRRLARMAPRGRADGSAYPGWYQSAGDRLYVAMDDREHGYELWVTDGTRRGTRLVRDIRTGRRDGIRPGNRPLGLISDVVIFAATDGVHGHELWRSDGTHSGTAMVRDIRPGRRGGIAWTDPAAVLGDVILFTADDGEHGAELWRTDGTDDGTSMVRDIRPGPEGSVPGTLAVFDELVYFLADDGVHGRELWRSDGTAEGTELVADINVDGPTHPWPAELTVVADTLFFTADDGLHGPELWRYEPEVTAGT